MAQHLDTLSSKIPTLVSPSWVVWYFTVAEVKVSLVFFRTLRQSQTWSRSCVQLPVLMNWWVSSILRTGLLSSVEPNFLLPNSLSGHSLADRSHWLTLKSQHLLLPTSIWISLKVCLNFCFNIPSSCDLRFLWRYVKYVTRTGPKKVQTPQVSFV